MTARAAHRVALGIKTRIGRATVVAVGGPADAAQVVAKVQLQVAATFEEGAVFHMGQELPLEEARALVRDSERRFIERATRDLAAFTAGLGAKIGAAALVAPAAKPLPPLQSILAAHPLVHAAEGELYRRVFVEAAAACGPRPARLPPDTLAARAAAALGLTPALVAARLAAMGKASGRPWAADQKEAALAAWLLLAPP
jgi:hypothetical protein